MIRVSGVTVRLGDRTIVDDVSFELAPGEVIALLGPNGAGKSTLFRAVAGTRPPTEGRIEIGGVDMRAIPRGELARRRAVLPQDAVLGFPFPVHEVVALGRSPHAGRAPGARDAAIVAAAMAAADVMHLAERSYPTLSGGERQRVQLARALAQVWPRPEGGVDGRGAGLPGTGFLLLDEPTSSLDLPHQDATLRVARDMAARGLGVLAVLHDPSLAARHADRILLLKDGRLAAAGAPGDVFRPDVLEHVYGMSVAVLRHPRDGAPVVVPA